MLDTVFHIHADKVGGGFFYHRGIQKCKQQNHADPRAVCSQVSEEC